MDVLNWYIYIYILYWLVVSTPLKNVSSSVGMMTFPILMEKYNMLYPYSHYIPIIFPLYSHHIPIIFPLYSHHIPIIFPLYSHYIPMIFPLYSHYNKICHKWHWAIALRDLAFATKKKENLRPPSEMHCPQPAGPKPAGPGDHPLRIPKGEPSEHHSDLKLTPYL